MKKKDPKKILIESFKFCAFASSLRIIIYERGESSYTNKTEQPGSTRKQMASSANAAVDENGSHGFACLVSHFKHILLLLRFSHFHILLI